MKCQAKGITRVWTQLDHIVPLHKGGPDTDENTQGLCDECHEAKTRDDLERQHKQTIGTDGWPV